MPETSIASRKFNHGCTRDPITRTNHVRPRLAASSYLNSAPLIWSFIHGSRKNDVEYTDAVPAHCAELLAAGAADFALVPVIEYQRMEGALLVPNVCVGSQRAVRSVIIVSKHKDLANVRRVALDASSRTSQALVKIVFREFLGLDPEWTESAPDLRVMMENNDAALLIGDPAMKILSTDFHVFDLASLWRRFTSTGFVFAMWMVRAEEVGAAGRVDFAGARDEGLEQMEQIISQYQIPLPREEMRRYLSDNITFELDQSLERGLLLYFELAQKHGLIEDNKPLQFTAS